MDSREPTDETILRIIAAQLSHDVAAVRHDHDIYEHLGATSTDIIEIALDLEAAFEIDLRNEDIDEMRTVGCAIRVVTSVRMRGDGRRSRPGEPRSRRRIARWWIFRSR